jgi:PHS family inorganic phosphate transporter-like MFS transporter
LGFGIGGDYPLSATIMSEYSNKNNRGAFVAAVFAMQGIGILTAAAVSIIVVSIVRHRNPGTPYGTSVELIQGSCPPEADFVWRIVLALGAVPAALTMYSRLLMPETPRYTLSVQGNVAKAMADVAKVSGANVAQVEVAPRQRMHMRQFLRLWWKPLLGTSVSWFMLDIAFYSQNLFQKDVFTAIGWIPKANTMNCLEETFKIARAQALIALGSTIPGYWFAVYFIDKVGRIPIQVGGFLLMTVFMATLAGAYNRLYENSQAGFITICAHPFCVPAHRS